jgi:gas vesicle protein
MFANNISKTFHDSKIIWIHRDPIKSITSYTNMIYEINKFYKRQVLKQDIAMFVMKKFKEMTNAMMHSMKTSNENIINIQYMDLITNKTKTVEFLSSKCNVEIKNGTSNQNQDDFNKLKSKITNEPGKLGIGSDEIYSKFNDYINKFNVIKEK